jgi:hypothetical protein
MDGMTAKKYKEYKEDHEPEEVKELAKSCAFLVRNFYFLIFVS